MIEAIKNNAAQILEKIDYQVEIGLILGSGLGVLAEEIEAPTLIDYSDLDNFPTSTVKGHTGRFVIGELSGKKVIAMQGRFHYYEGYSMEKLTLPVRVMKELGIEKLLLTNAAGGVNANYSPGEFMLISDHLNFIGDNPLRGKNMAEYGPRFPDMTEAYSKDLIVVAEEAAKDNSLLIRKGVYAAMSGPTYETPAEIKFLAAVGADAVGMSTVPEVIVARHMGIEVLGISCITNMAAGILAQPLDHSEVVETAERVKADFIKLMKDIIKKI
ncbi:purine-nucleoside phosphorylase [Halanaerobium hydrogeniformans]|uniref:Purine nucleoside phosphorylase n=1 Tax=Halanaerobium hydrogeniformans TaxID=656519 RepID=E4RL44_HALHG|nr:purine-nucleoside phosphorylase [Halanaerobium hydrogeniformans]ADQ14808.1 inosine guanosine and xanthosine phosphorylase family [Halanaerobium hydrogeniformans]